MCASLFIAGGCATGSNWAAIGHLAGGAVGALVLPPLSPVLAAGGLLIGAKVDESLANTPEAKERERHRQAYERQILRGQLSPGSESDGLRLGVAGKPIRVWADESFENGRLVAGRFEERSLP